MATEANFSKEILLLNRFSQQSLYTIYSFSGLQSEEKQSEEKPSKGSTPNGNYPVESEVKDKDERDEEK